MSKITTKQEYLGPIFGDGLLSFDPTGRPTMSDIVRHWMYKYDEKRGNKAKISEKIKDDVINEIVEALINI